MGQCVAALEAALAEGEAQRETERRLNKAASVGAPLEDLVAAVLPPKNET